MKLNTFRLLVFFIICLVQFICLSSSAFAQQHYFLKNNSGLQIRITTNPDSMYKQFGPRFDHSAWVSSVNKLGHEYLNPNGLSDEFGIEGIGVLNYTEAIPGQGDFLKIGFGTLKKQQDKPYIFWTPYPVVSRVETRVKQQKNSITFYQESEKVNGYSYYYEKKYLLWPASNQLIISYRLKNTGTKAFGIEHYNHHWFCFDSTQIDSLYMLETEFGLSAPEPNSGFAGNTNYIRAKGSVLPRKNLYFGQSKVNGNGELIISHQKLPQRIKVSTSKRPVSRFALYLEPYAFCPELFIQRQIMPGQYAEWQHSYSFELKK